MGKEKIEKNKCRNAEFNYKVEKKNKKYYYFINFKSLPEYYQNLYLFDESDYCPNSSYSEAPAWAKAQADKYSYVIKNTEKIKGKELFEYIDNWNNKNPEGQITYSSLMRMKQRYKNSC